MAERLTESQRGTLHHFLEVAQELDERRAIQVLQRHNWSLEAALSEHLDRANSAAGETEDSGDGENGIRRRRGSRDEDSRRSRASGSTDGQRTSRGPAEREETRSTGLLGTLFNVLLSPLRFLTGLNGDIDSKEAVTFFLREFNSKCQDLQSTPEERPTFVETSYRDALAKAAREEKLLLVYLHSMQHPDSERFIRQVLCSSPIAQIINERMIAWGGCVEFAESYHLSSLLNVASYPYVAILEPPADPNQLKAKLLERVEGKVEFGSMQSKIARATEQHGSIIAQRVAARFETEERQRIRREQDEALQRALEEDRRREEEQRRQQEEEMRAKEEEEERARREQEEAQAKEIQARREYEKKLASVPKEPEDEKGKVISIRFQLPTGKKFERRFPVDATMRDLRNYVDCQLFELETPIENYAVVLNFPKKTFGPDADMSITMKENGMFPQAVLLIQDLDS